MIRIAPAISPVAALLAVVLVAPVQAAEKKEESCKYQGQVMAAVQAARMDRVKQEKVEEVILASDPEWPEQYSKAIPQLTAHVYAIKRRDLRNADLGAILEQQCLENWDQIQAMTKQLKSN
jgi:methylthioribose-1-phosphate isomerase